MSVGQGRDPRITRRRALAGGLLVGLGASAAALGGRLGRREASAQPKPAVTVHKSPT